MIERIIYVANDGTEFHSKEKCIIYEKLLYRVSYVMADFRKNKNKDGQNITVRQDAEMVKNAYNKFLKICEDVMEKHGVGNIFKEARTNPESVHPSHLQYYLGDYSKEYPILWATYCRFENINFESGIEYTQPYYAKHEDEYKWEIY